MAAGTGPNKDGVVITDVDTASDAAQKGIKSGDVILEVGDVAVKTPDDLANGVKEATKLGRKAVLMRVKSGDQTRFVAGTAEEELTPFSQRVCQRRGGLLPPDMSPRFASSGRPPTDRRGRRRMRIAGLAAGMAHARACDRRRPGDGPVPAAIACGRAATRPTLPATARPASRMASEGNYDVLIVDRMLPRRDGLSVVQTAAGRGRAHAGADPVGAGRGR